jgi:autotransporter translocation and assembly factor TamB
MRPVANRRILVSIIAGVIVIGLMLSALSFYLVRDRSLTRQVSLQFKKSLQPLGLNLYFDDIKWLGWGRFTCSGPILTDISNGEVLLKAEAINISVNPLDFVLKPNHPEVLLSRLELIKPYGKIARLEDGTWNFQRYFSKKKRKIFFQAKLKLTAGVIELSDSQYGDHRFAEVNGTIDFGGYPKFRFNLNGISDLNHGLRWKLSGTARMDRQTGTGTGWLWNARLQKISAFLPQRFQYPVRGGSADLRLDFSWGRKSFWVDNGKISVSKARIAFPRIGDRIEIDKLIAEVRPDRLMIDQARLRLGTGTVNGAGKMDLRSMALRLTVSGDRVLIHDLTQLIRNNDYAFKARGTTNFRLIISGTLEKPVFDGNLYISGAELMLSDYPAVRKISGRFSIRKNDLTVHKLEGRWGEALVGLSGNVRRILTPEFDLKIYGVGINPGFTQVDLSKFTQDKLEIGKVNLDGKIIGGLKTAGFSGTVDFEHIKYQKIEATNVHSNLTWRIGASGINIHELSAELWKGMVLARGELRIDPRKAGWRLSGSVKQVNLSEIPVDPSLGLSGQLGLEVVAQGGWEYGQEFNPGNIMGTFEGKNCDFKEFHLDGLTGLFSWNRQGVFTVESIQGRIGAAGQGMIFGRLTYDQNDLAGDFSLNNISLNAVASKTSYHDYPLDGRIEGELQLHGSLRNPMVRFNGSIHEAIWFNHPLGDFEGDLTYADLQLEVGRFAAHTVAGDLQLTGTIGLDGSLPLRLELVGKDLRLKNLGECFPWVKTLGIEGLANIKVDAGGRLSNPEFSGTVDLVGPKVKNLAMDRGKLIFSGVGNKLHVSQLLLLDQDTQIRAVGEIGPERIDLDFSTERFNLDQIALKYGGKDVHGIIDAKGKVYGKPEQPLVSVTINGSDLGYGAIMYQSLSSEFRWDSNQIEIVAAELRKDSSSVQVYGRIQTSGATNLDVGVRVSGCELQDLIGETNLPLNVTGEVSGLIQISGTVNDPVTRISGRIDNGTLNQISLKGEFDFLYSRNTVRIERVQLEHETGTMTANGQWRNGQNIKLKVLTHNFPLQVFQSLLKFESGFQGNISAEIGLEGGGSGYQGDCRIDISGLGFNGKAIGDLSLAGVLSDQGLKVTQGVLSRKNVSAGEILKMEGYIPWPAAMLQALKLPVRTEPIYRYLNLDLSARNFPAESLSLGLDQIAIEKGALSGSLHLVGNLQHPDLFGNLNCSGGKLTISELPLPIEGLELRFIFEGRKMAINSLSGSYGKGQFQSSGTIGLADWSRPELNLAFSGNRLYYKNSYFDGYGDAKLKLTGEVTKLKIAGEVSVYNCKMGVLNFQSHKKTRSWNPTLDLVLKTGRNARYRQYGIADMVVEGSVNIRGPIANPLINGRAHSKSGVLTLYGQSFKVNRGEAVFNDYRGFTPFIDIDSSVKTSKAEVFLGIKGRIGGNVNFNLSSQPYLSQTELFSILNWSELNGDKPFTLDGAVDGNITIVTDALFGEVFYEVRKVLNVDYFYLEHDFREKKFKLNVGDNLTKDLFLSYSRWVTDEPKETWGLDYQLTPKLLGGGSYSTDQGLSARLMYRIRF